MKNKVGLQNHEHAPVRFGNKIAIDPCSNLTHKMNILVIEDELLEEEKKEEVEQRPEEPTITVSRGDMGSFRVAGEWVDPTITNYTYTAYTTTANAEPIYVHDTYRL